MMIHTMVAHELMPAFGRARHRQPMGLRAHRSLALPASCIHAPVEHRSAGSEQRWQRRPRICLALHPGQGERTGLPQRALSERCFLALPLPCDRGRCCGWPHLLHHLRRPVPLLAVGSSSGTAPPCPQSCSRNGRLGRLLVGSAGTGSPTSWHPQRSAPSLSWCERRGLARGVGWPPSGLAWWQRSGWRPWPRRTQSLDPGALSGWRSRACSHYEIRPGGAPYLVGAGGDACSSRTWGGIIEGPFELSPPDPFRLYPPGPFRLQPQVLFASTPRSVSRSNFFSSQRAPNAHKNLRKK
jgi:hypothetical protein